MFRRHNRGGQESERGKSERRKSERQVSERQKSERQKSERGNCAYCRARVHSSSAEMNPLELCQACYRQIPWIRDIYCEACGRYEACYDCRRRENTQLQCNRSAVKYDEAMKQWLSLYKYRGDERLLRLFANMMMHAYRKLLEIEDLQRSLQQAPQRCPFDCITFVPLSDERLLERGFNQAEQLAQEISRKLRVPLISTLLRVRHTEKMSFKRRSERLRDLSGVFTINAASLPKLSVLLQQHAHNPTTSTSQRPLNILLIDDVYTTGSTLHQCAALILEHIPAQVYSLTWAR